MTVEKLTGSQSPLQVHTIQKITSETERDRVSNGNESKETEIFKNRIISKEDVEKTVQSLNDFMKPTRTNLKFELHDKLDKYFVKVIDSETKDVIKEIPPKKMLDMYAAMADFMGFLVDKKI